MLSLIEPQSGFLPRSTPVPAPAGFGTKPATAGIATVLIGSSGLYQDGLIRILEEHGYVVVDAIERVDAFDPTCEPALLLLSEFGEAEITRSAIPHLHSLAPQARIAILTEPSDAATLGYLLSVGVQACLDHLTPPAALIKSLNVVMNGNIVMPMEAVSHLGRRAFAATPCARSAPPAADLPLPTDTLTCREAEILSCLAGGLPNKMIARRLAIAEATVKIHVKNILRKTGVRNRTQAAIWTHRRGIRPVVPEGV